MMLTEEMIAKDEKRWHSRNIVAELGYCGKNICHRKSITNDDIRFYAYIMRKAYALLKEQESVVRCKDCVHWIPGEITDKDDFIQPRCRRNGGGWASDDYCSCAERREAACTSNCTS